MIQKLISKLISPATLAPIGNLQSRIVMAAMTRSFAVNHCATAEMNAYYTRRAKGGVGLILTEGVIIDPSGDGYNNVPYMATEQQAESWKPIIESVHANGGRIFCQLWHCGRISHSDFTGGIPPVSSTDRAAEGINRQNNKPYGVPHKLSASEIQGVYKMFQKAAARAIAVGFDGVQLHMGHGYLADQFFDARVNDRTDNYGGSVPNRCRFAIELLEQVIAEVGTEKTMVRISPARDMGGPYDWPNFGEMIAHLIPAFASKGLKMLDVSNANADYFKTAARAIDLIRPIWKGILIGGASLTPEQAEQEISSGRLDLVTWGRTLIANPDFISQIKNNIPLKNFDRAMLDRLE